MVCLLSAGCRRQYERVYSIRQFGALFRFATLDRWRLWTDELHAIAMADAIDDLHKQGPPDQHPPLYHLITSQLTTVSIDETWLRLPSAISGFLAIVPLWKTGVALEGRRLGLMAAALAAFSPLLIWYAREARMYGVATGFRAAFIHHCRCLNAPHPSQSPVTVLALAFVLSSYTFLSQPYQDWRGATIYLTEQAARDDIIIVYPRWHRSALEYHRGQGWLIVHCHRDPPGPPGRRFPSIQGPTSGW